MLTVVSASVVSGTADVDFTVVTAVVSAAVVSVAVVSETVAFVVSVRTESCADSAPQPVINRAQSKTAYHRCFMRNTSRYAVSLNISQITR